MNILLIGSGGREHAMARKISESSLCDKLYVAPGNAGTALCGKNISLDPMDFQGIGKFVLAHAVDMVVAGPEAPLVKGLRDYFNQDDALSHVRFVGPDKQGARLEGSKAFAKAFMERHRVPTAAYRAFAKDDFEEAVAFLDSCAPPYVLKADGLAAGKGVVICDTKEEAKENLEGMLLNDRFGEASHTVVIEEYLQGREMSVFVLTDGRSYRMLPSAKDYKRIGERDTGANTGGMGAVSPVPFAGQELMQRIEERIIKPTIQGITKEDMVYCGFLFFGLMICGNDPYVIEYNVRLGDPEAEVILPRIDSDLAALMQAACDGDLDAATLKLSSDYALFVVLASGGYPNTYDKGFEIRGLEQVSESLLYYAGMKSLEGKLVTGGGRVMAVCGRGHTLQEAREQAYRDLRLIDYKGKYFRRDIGQDLLKYT